MENALFAWEDLFMELKSIPLQEVINKHDINSEDMYGIYILRALFRFHYFLKSYQDIDLIFDAKPNKTYDVVTNSEGLIDYIDVSPSFNFPFLSSHFLSFYNYCLYKLLEYTDKKIFLRSKILYKHTIYGNISSNIRYFKNLKNLYKIYLNVCKGYHSAQNYEVIQRDSGYILIKNETQKITLLSEIVLDQINSF